MWSAPPSTFERESTKFWVRPGDDMRLKVALCQHLLLLIFNTPRQLVPGAARRTWRTAGCSGRDVPSSAALQTCRSPAASTTPA